MEAIRMETTVEVNGAVTLSGLPFEAGKQVEVIVREAGTLTQPPFDFAETAVRPFQGQMATYLHDPFATADAEEGQPNLYPLRGTPYTYLNPYDPVVAPEDWEALR